MGEIELDLEGSLGHGIRQFDNERERERESESRM